MPMSDVEILRAACCVAGIDGVITDAEKRLLDKLADKAGVGSASLQAMMNRAKSDPQFVREQFSILRAEPKTAMSAILGVAVADGMLSDAERAVVVKLAEKLGFNESDREKLLGFAQKHIDKQRSAE